MNENISDFKLEQWLQGELSQTEAERIASIVAQNKELAARIEQLKKHTEEFLRKHPPDQFRMAVEQKLHLANAQQKHNAHKRSTGGFYWRISAGVLAVCIALIVIVPGLLDKNQQATTNQTNPTENSGIRIKGERVYLMAHLVETETVLIDDQEVKKQKQTRLLDGDQVKPGDRIQLSINHAQGRSFVIFSIDGAGVTSDHYATESTSPTEKRDFFPLQNSYRLDNAPDFENFYLVSAEKPLRKQDILDKAEEAQKEPIFIETFRKMLDPEVTVNVISLKKANQ